MSGYDPKSGIFELNWSKANRYWHGPTDPSIHETDWRRYCAEMFRRAGFEVLRQTPYSIDVVADDADVYEVLSGKEATWGRATPPAKKAYERWQATREWFNPTDLGKALSPPVGPVKVNRLLEEIGYQVKSEGVWKPTPLAAGKYELRSGAQVFKHGDQQVPVWRRCVIDVLQPLLVSRGKPGATTAIAD